MLRLFLLLEYAHHLGDGFPDLLLGLAPPLLEDLLLAQLHLLPALVHALPELAIPLPAEVVEEAAAAVHEMLLPDAFVGGAVGEVEPSPSVMFVIEPFPTVDRSIRVVVGPEARHLIVLPVALVVLLPRPILQINWEREFPIPLLDLSSLHDLPPSFIGSPVQILESPVSLNFIGKWLWLDLLRRFLYCILGVLLRSHFYNLNEQMTQQISLDSRMLSSILLATRSSLPHVSIKDLEI